MIFSGARFDSNPTKFHWYLASTPLTMMVVSLFGIHKTYRLNSFHCQQTLGINCDMKNNFHLRSHCYTNKLRMYNEMDMFWVWLCFSLNLFWSTLPKGCIATFSLRIHSICASYRNFNIHLNQMHGVSHRVISRFSPLFYGRFICNAFKLDAKWNE